MTRTRMTAVFLVLFAAVASFGQAGLENPRPGEELYLVVLGQDAAEPDVAVLGGRILRWWSDRRVVAVSPEAAEALRSHAGVAYVQRIWTGEAFEAATSMRAPTEVAPTVAPPPWTTGHYEYDSSGNIKSMGSDSFAYDAVGRVVKATVQGQTETYLFDPYGNLRQLGSRALAVHEATNRLIGFGYDDVGNMTTDADGRTYHYDPLGMVTAIDVAATDTLGHDLRMIYTADDERIVVAEGTTTTRYRVRDFGARVLREWKNTGEILEWERDYLYAGGELVAGEVQVDQRQNGLRHYHKDHLGSTRMVTDGAGELVSRHDYLPFGAEPPPTTTEYANTGKGPRDPKKFTGHERDYLSVANVDGDYLDYMHARYYSPEWGRFLSVDPAWESADLVTPQTWNRYAYVRNNPINRTDPDGRMDGNGMGEPVEWACPGCTRAEQLQQSNRIAKGTAIGAAVSLAAIFGGPPAWRAITSLAMRHLGASGGSVVLGETMRRVRPAASALAARTFETAAKSGSQIMSQNMQWLQRQMASGAKIYDIGIDAARKTGSAFYKAEVQALMDAGYTRQFLKVVKIDDKLVRLYQWVAPK